MRRLRLARPVGRGPTGPGRHKATEPLCRGCGEPEGKHRCPCRFEAEAAPAHSGQPVRGRDPDTSCSHHGGWRVAVGFSSRFLFPSKSHYVSSFIKSKVSRVLYSVSSLSSKSHRGDEAHRRTCKRPQRSVALSTLTWPSES